MANLNEIQEAINVLIKNGTTRKNIIIFHCVSSYPTNLRHVNLNSILFLKKN